MSVLLGDRQEFDTKKLCHANFNCYHHTSSKLKHSQYCQMKVFQDGKSR